MKSCFIAKVLEGKGVGATGGLFRDPIGPQLLTKVATELRAVGFRVSDARRGKACDAGFTASFDKFRVVIILLARRRAGLIECALLTWLAKSSWLTKIPTSAEAEWESLCAAMEQSLKRIDTIISVERLTRAEAEQRVSR